MATRLNGNGTYPYGISRGWVRDRVAEGLTADDCALIAKAARAMGVTVEDILNDALDPGVRLAHIGSRTHRGRRAPVYRIIQGDAAALIAWLERYDFARFPHASPLTIMRATLHNQIAAIGIGDDELAVAGGPRAVIETATLLDALCGVQR